MGKWHHPGTLAVDRARAVARTCWDALDRVDPETARVIAWAAREAGEGWLTPEVARHGPDDWVTVSTAADLVGRSVRWVYAWVAKDRTHRMLVDRNGRILVRVGAVRDAVAARALRSPPADICRE